MIINGDELVQASDSEKLVLLAEWLDAKYPDDPSPEVQDDLRMIAAKLERYEAQGGIDG